MQYLGLNNIQRKYKFKKIFDVKHMNKAEQYFKYFLLKVNRAAYVDKRKGKQPQTQFRINIYRNYSLSLL